MLGEPDPATERVIAAIEAYLARHPAAADSVQGVARWWLPAEGVDEPIEQVRRALEFLRMRGVIEVTQLPDGGAVYRTPVPSAPQSPDLSDEESR